MSVVRSSTTSLRWAIVLGLSLGLAACGDKPAAPPAAQAAAAADAAVNQAAQAQAAALAALSAEELKTRGRQALREQRIYSPAGNNAIEYYVALRKKSAKPDASAESALMDLSPYAVIAAEQAIARSDFNEAERLRQLVAAADPQAPSLTRIADAIAKGRAATVAAPPPAEKTPEQLRIEQAARDKAAADATALQAQAAAAAARQPEAVAAPPVQQPAPPPAPDPVVTAPPRPAPVQAAPSRPAAPSSDLVPISTPQPAYPPEAARAGTSGEVVLSFTVNADGSVSNIELVSAKPRGVFERATQAAVRRWKFQPISAPQNVTRTFSFTR